MVGDSDRLPSRRNLGQHSVELRLGFGTRQRLHTTKILFGLFRLVEIVRIELSAAGAANRTGQAWSRRKPAPDASALLHHRGIGLGHNTAPMSGTIELESRNLINVKVHL